MRVVILLSLILGALVCPLNAQLRRKRTETIEAFEARKKAAAGRPAPAPAPAAPNKKQALKDLKAKVEKLEKDVDQLEDDIEAEIRKL